MKSLVVEDDFASRKLLQKIMETHGDCDVAVDGKEAMRAFELAWIDKKPYDLVLIDIMLPLMDGQDLLKKIRLWEEKHGVLGFDGVKIIMTTALGDSKNIMTAFREQCEGYVIKPISKEKIVNQLEALGLTGSPKQ